MLCINCIHFWIGWLTITYNLLTSMDYHNILYIRLFLKTTQKLKLNQNTAAWILMGTIHGPYVKTLLWELHWLPVSFWVQLKMFIITYNALHNTGPDYRAAHLQLLMSDWQDQCLSSIIWLDRRHQFSIAVPTLWTSISPENQTASVLSAFLKSLKIWLEHNFYESILIYFCLLKLLLAQHAVFDYFSVVDCCF